MKYPAEIAISTRVVMMLPNGDGALTVIGTPRKLSVLVSTKMLPKIAASTKPMMNSTIWSTISATMRSPTLPSAVPAGPAIVLRSVMLPVQLGMLLPMPPPAGGGPGCCGCDCQPCGCWGGGGGAAGGGGGIFGSLTLTPPERDGAWHRHLCAHQGALALRIPAEQAGARPFWPVQPPIRDISTREGSIIANAGKRLDDGVPVAAGGSSE